MTLEFKPLGNSCNMGCTYCYQEPMRLAGNAKTVHHYDLDKMIEIADGSGLDLPFTLFGGEALLVPKKDLEYLFKEGYKRHHSNSIQTNGSLIDDEHIELFKKYSVNVGVSIDGPGEMNRLRLPLSKKQNVDELTEKTINNIEKLVKNNIDVGIIITVHKLNGAKDKIDKLIDFISWLTSIGINHGNLHMLEVDSLEAKKYLLDSDENADAFLKLARFVEDNKINWGPFNDMKRMQMGDNQRVSCVWKSCDAMNTQAVYGIEGDGQISNCGMVNKEGIEWTKAQDTVYIRDWILYNTEQENGGCKDCPFFLMCNGYCPGASIDNDWRNKTIHCKTIKKIFKFYEDELTSQSITPFSKRLDRKFLESKYISFIENNPNSNPPTINRLIRENKINISVKNTVEED